MIDAPHFAATGARHKAAFTLPADPFDGTVHEAVLHQAVTVFLGNQRQGTHATKTRRWVAGGNQKPWRQKGTGRARQGTIRAPQWRGGGIVFGPHPRDYRAGIPRKVRQLARRSALNARAREGALLVVDPVGFEAPKTKRLMELLGKMGLDQRKVLVLTNGVNRNLVLSGRNLPAAQVMPWAEASAYDILWADTVVVEQGALTGEAPLPAADAAAVEERAARKTAAKAQRGKGAKAQGRKDAKAPGREGAKAQGRKGGKTRAAKAPKAAAKKPAKKPAAKKKKKGRE